MARNVEAWINGKSIFSASNLVILRKPMENAPEMNLETAERPVGPGERLIGVRRTRLTVRLEFALRNIFDLRARAQALEAVNAWAQDGLLTVNYRPFRQLQMHVIQRAALGDVRDYNQVYAIECAAIECPFWESTALKTAGSTGSQGTVRLIPEGTVPRIPLSFSVTPHSEALTELSVAVNGQSITFADFSLDAGKSLILSYDDQMRQRITLDGVSSQDARTRDSADDLFVYPRQDNEISFSANTDVNFYVNTRGLYL